MEFVGFLAVLAALCLPCCFFFSIGDFPTILPKMDGQIHVKQEPNAIMTDTFTFELNTISMCRHS